MSSKKEIIQFIKEKIKQNFLKPSLSKIIFSSAIILIVEYWLYLFDLRSIICAPCPPEMTICPPCPKHHGEAIKFALSKIIFVAPVAYVAVSIILYLYKKIIKK